MKSLSSVAIRYENDVVLARQRARQIAALLGFEGQDQARIATAVSEIARNAFSYAHGGRIELRLEGRTAPQVFVIEVTDKGPGIADLEGVLSGTRRSSTGMGLGLIGAKRLMDQFEIETELGCGTRVTLKRLLPRQQRALGDEDVARIVAELSSVRPQDPWQEIQQQNQELLRALEELSRRQEELTTLNRELEDTNRGVVALYAELDERADHLRRADDLKSRFLSNMSHEFRTPVNSIQALSRMLLDRLDGDLTPEQERQVVFIRKAADDLAELVSDLLDLAKVEAGKIVVRPAPFEVSSLFGALRGMLRPLLVNESVSLVFQDPDGISTLYTDEAKVSQILRNFISNALKFTERGEVRVSARMLDAGTIGFTVADTGIGIAPEDQERIFDEFVQVENPVQRHVKGTGLGLPLCRKLAALLGGAVSVESTPHLGSTFRATLPTAYAVKEPERSIEWLADLDKIPVLVVEDQPETILTYEKFLAGTSFQMLAVRTVREARDALATVKPRVVILDILLPGEDAWGLLTEIKRRPDAARISVMVVTNVEDVGKGLALGADVYVMKPVDRDRLLKTLTRLVQPEGAKKILVVDDEEISRYLLRQSLAKMRHKVIEANGGIDGLRLARAEHPDLICLDLTMPELDGFELLNALKNDPTTCDIPVLIVTSRALEARTHSELIGRVAGVLTKDRVSSLPAMVEEALSA
ncbi:MAG: ATP-binding protein [Thermodesulfobacteriota bacterium]